MIRMFQVRMAPGAPQSVAEVLESGYIGQGPKVELFERQLQSLLGHEHLLTVNSCTAALDLALHLCGVGAGDEVVTTPITCTATNAVIVRRGATPVWADVDPHTGLISPDDVGRKITSRTKAIMAVDWGGQPCDWSALKAFDLPVIEDAAHAFLARTGGDFVCYSFQAIKHLTTGDGGALVVPPHLVERAKRLRWYGLDRSSSLSFRCAQNIREIGYKYHMNDIAAAIGLANMEGVEEAVACHRSNAAYYQRELEGLSNVQLPSPSAESAWWLYTLLHPSKLDRDRFEAHMLAAGIETSRVHARNDRHDGFRFPNGPLPGIQAFDDRQTSIPVGWWLSDEGRHRIVQAVRAWDSMYGDRNGSSSETLIPLGAPITGRSTVASDGN